MSQREIMEILKNHPNKWYSSKMLVDETGLSRTAIQTSVRCLIKWSEVEAKYMEADDYDVPRAIRYIKWKS